VAGSSGVANCVYDSTRAVDDDRRLLFSVSLALSAGRLNSPFNKQSHVRWSLIETGRTGHSDETETRAESTAHRAATAWPMD